LESGRGKEGEDGLVAFEGVGEAEGGDAAFEGGGSGEDLDGGGDEGADGCGEAAPESAVGDAEMPGVTGEEFIGALADEGDGDVLAGALADEEHGDDGGGGDGFFDGANDLGERIFEGLAGEEDGGVRGGVVASGGGGIVEFVVVERGAVASGVGGARGA
jgi:hypothetical protein